MLRLSLPDGRSLLARMHRPRHGFGWLGGLLLLAVAIAIGAYPVVRRITRRLEPLQTRVDALGAGDLEARVQVEGSTRWRSSRAASTVPRIASSAW